MRKSSSLLSITFCLGLAPALARAADPPPPAAGTYEQVWGVPNTSGQVVIKITIRVGGVPRTMTVTIPRGTIMPFVPPANIPGETPAEYYLRYAVARGEASQAKAADIAAAINMAFSLTGANRLTTGTMVRSQTYLVNRPGIVPAPNTQNVTLGTIVIPNAARAQPTRTNPMGDPVEFIDLAGEGGETLLAQVSVAAATAAATFGRRELEARLARPGTFKGSPPASRPSPPGSTDLAIRPRSISA